MSPKTPVFGLPSTHAAIESLREDLRQHSATDERELATIRGDVKSLIRETAGQTETLSQIQGSLSTRAITEAGDVKYRRKKRLLLYGALLSISSAVCGALIHHFL